MTGPKISLVDPNGALDNFDSDPRKFEWKIKVVFTSIPPIWIGGDYYCDL
jgi:hypothetical protein